MVNMSLNPKTRISWRSQIDRLGKSLSSQPMTGDLRIKASQLLHLPQKCETQQRLFPAPAAPAENI
ncbi:MAG: hypothetical protein RMZ42_16780 [Nostoc sp. DedQUE05]|uniref:hypothetical protein n=1 Tax=Nostoc sp. DedQUE05 TaxID=3075391 RepID=UPI002AD430DB|nr:hypothetical protein [Nostoc sp. DedQUE05]MDZ8093565.1 hypothetical protein [Nostoc sp. DedQUE05]